MEDEYAAIWMTIDNAFTEPLTNPAPPPWDRWSGVLFQLGYFWKYDAAGGEQQVGGGSRVVIEGNASTNNTLVLDLNEFTWLNIVAQRAAAAPPITLDQVQVLAPLADLGIDQDLCSQIEQCAQGTGTGCDPALLTIPKPCLRLRSLRAYFVPLAMITYWQGSDGYTMSAAWDPVVKRHNKYTFTFNAPVSIAVWKNSNPKFITELADLGDIIRVRIELLVDPDDGDIHDPPTSGGPRRPPGS